MPGFVRWLIKKCPDSSRKKRWLYHVLRAYVLWRAFAQRFSHKGIKHSFDTAWVNAGIEDFRFHDLRHTFASRLVQGGVPLYNVMHLTGHKSLEMVQRYAYLAPEYQEAAIAVLDQRPITRPDEINDTVCHDLVTLPIEQHVENKLKSLKEMVPLG